MGPLHQQLEHLRFRRGRAVQVDPIKPTLKAPGPERLKLKHEELLSKFGFKINLRRYIVVFVSLLSLILTDLPGISTLRLMRAFRVFRLFKVRQCRLTLSNPR